MRLIDADAVAEAIRDALRDEDNPNFILGLSVGLAYVTTAETIDAVPRWVPCEERLPEPNVAVLGYAPEFNNIFAVYYDSVCGWMIWSPAYDEPFPSCQGEIVAWMPMPEPWKEESNATD